MGGQGATVLHFLFEVIADSSLLPETEGLTTRGKFTFNEGAP